MLGPAARVPAAARAFSELRVADELRATEFAGKDWTQLSKGQKVKAMRGEIAQPGSIIDGAPRARTIKFQPGPEEKVQAAQQSYSRSPLRRDIQMINDKFSHAFPNVPLAGAKSRVNRANAVRVDRGVLRKYGGLEGADSLLKLPQEGLMRAWAEGQLVQRPAHLIGESANLPEHAADLAKHNAHVDSEIGRLKQALQQEYDHTPGKGAALPEWVRKSVQAGFGQQLMDGLDKAIAHQPTKDYHRAYGYLHGASNLSRQVILDSHGFSALKNDLTRAHDRVAQYEQLADEGELVRPEKLTEARDNVTRLEASLKDAVTGADEMMRERQVLPKHFVDVHTLQFPERDAWSAEWAKRGAPQDKIDAMMAITNQQAIKHPEGPAAFWRDKIGSPSDKSAYSFMGDQNALFQDFPAYGRSSLIEGSGAAPAKTSKYHSGLQQEVGNLDWGSKGTRQAGQVKADLRKATDSKGKPLISKNEWDNSGLDNFFEAHKGEMITEQMLNEHLATPLNAFNLVEHHRINTAEARGTPYVIPGTGDETHFGTVWDDFGNGNLLSRDPREGEYHEISFELPDTVPVYMGKGSEHWHGQPNVTVHMRFQTFEEDGVRKLLIEEIQSDWARQHTAMNRERKGFQDRLDELNSGLDDPFDTEERANLERSIRDRTYTPLPEGFWEKYDTMTKELHELQSRGSKLNQELDSIRARLEGGGLEDTGDLYDRYDKVMDELIDVGVEHEDAMQKIGMYADMADASGTAPPFFTNPTSQKMAINRVLMHAAEHDIEEVLLTHSSIQHVRNEAYQNHIAREIERMTPKDVLAMDKGQAPKSQGFVRTYDQELPKLISEVLGEGQGLKTEGTFEGQFRSQLSRDEAGEWGQMPAHSWKVTPEGKASAMKPRALYQRQPDWSRLPKGATEFLEDGKSRIYMFQGADVSTWMHELFHVSMPDLEGPHRKVLEDYYGGGKAMEEWDAAAHENAARDFEQFLRSGKIQNRLLASAFASIKDWMRQLLGQAKEEGKLPSDVEQAFSEIFREPGARDADIPDFFIPHRARAPELMGKSGSKGIARANRDIGDWVPHSAKEQLFARNNLNLLRSGLINPDPRLLVDHVNRLVSLQRANSIREFLLEHASPLMPNETVTPGEHYVIKKAGTSINKPLYDALEVADDPEALRTAMQDLVDDNISDRQSVIDAWKQDESKGLGSGRAGQLYKIDKASTDQLFKYLTGKKPGEATTPSGTFGKLADATLDTWRGLLLYGNPGFYMANFLGNTYMMAMSDPRAMRYMGWSLNNARKAATGPATSIPSGTGSR